MYSKEWHGNEKLGNIEVTMVIIAVTEIFFNRITAGMVNNDGSTVGVGENSR